MKQLIIFLTFTIIGLTQIVAGLQGINFHFGSAWAFLALISLLFFGFSLPLTIASFFGATDVWGLHWILALVIAVPGILFLIPGTVFQFIKKLPEIQSKIENTKPMEVSFKTTILCIIVVILCIYILLDKYTLH